MPQECTLLFTDIKDSTTIARKRGSARYERNLLTGNMAILKTEIETRFQGTIHPDQSEGINAYFSDPMQAILCAVELQKSIEIHASQTTVDDGVTHRSSVRLGLHTAETDPEGRPTRLAVNYAASVMNLAEAGQILLSRDMYAEVEPRLSDKCRVWDNRYLKGATDLEPVYEYLYDGVRRREPGTRLIPIDYAQAAAVYIERPRVERSIREWFFEKGHGQDGATPYLFVTICGCGGMGKTRLTVHCGKQMAGMFPGGVYFVSLAERIKISRTSLANEICKAFYLQTSPTGDPAQRLFAFLRGNRETLLILDDAESISSDEEAKGFLEELVEGCEDVRLLATSREPLQSEIEVSIDINDGLEPAEAVQLLLTRVQEANGTKPPPDAAAPELKQLMADAGHIPLAIEFLAAHSQEYDTVAELQDDYQKAKQNCDPAAEERFKSLLASLEWSWDRLGTGQDGIDARSAFLAASLFAEPFTPEALAATLGWDDTPRIEDAISLLENASLLRTVDGTDLTRYRMHQFPRSYGREERYRNEPGLPPMSDLRDRFLSYYEDMVAMHGGELQTGDAEESGLLLHAEWRNVLEAVSVARSAGQYSRCVALHLGLSEYFSLSVNWLEGEISAKVAHHVAVQEWKDLDGERQTLGNLGLAYQSQRRWSEAEQAYQQSLTISREFKDRPGERQTLNNLGIVYQSQRRWPDAEQVYLQEIAICREFEDRLGERETLNNLGVVYRSLKRWSDAERIYLQDVAICREFEDLYDEGQTLNNLGAVYRSQGRLSDAEQTYQQSLTISRSFKDEHGVSEALNSLGRVYESQGRWSEAEQAYQESLAIKREFGDLRGEVQTLNNLGAIYRSQGRWSAAEQTYEQSLTILWDLKDRHIEAQTLGNVALLYVEQGQPDAAAVYAQDGLAAAKLIEDATLIDALNTILANCLPQAEPENGE